MVVICDKKKVISTRVTRCITVVVLLQCLLLLLYLVITQSPKDRTVSTSARNTVVTQDDDKKVNILHPPNGNIKVHRKVKHPSILRSLSQNKTAFLPSFKQGTNYLNRSRNDSKHNLMIYRPSKRKSMENKNPYIILYNNEQKNGTTTNYLWTKKHSNFISKQISSKLIPTPVVVQGSNGSILKQNIKTTAKTYIQERNFNKNTIYDLSVKYPHSQDSKFSVKNSFARNLFENYNPRLPGTRVLLTDTKPYLYKVSDNVTCFVHGTVIESSNVNCSCKTGWYGSNCSVPESVYTTFSYKYSGQGVLRSKPKRLINAIIFNIEWDLLEARMNELGDIVDMFVILESNYTMFGDPKPLRLLRRLRQGYLKRFHHKIIYIFLDHFPPKGKEDGWVTDRYLRNYIGSQWMKQLTNIKEDDVLVYTDTDELPSAESMLYVKLHDGYGEPFGLTLRWSVFGFFWRANDPTRIMVGSSVKFLLEVLQGNMYDLRTVDYAEKYAAGLSRYVKNGGRTNEWYIGDGPFLAGWHCSWCLSPKSVVIKLTSAINADFPRWGDYPEKLRIPYIQNLIRTGTWFDDRTKVGILNTVDTDQYFAPKYLIKNFNRYKHLLDIKFAA